MPKRAREDEEGSPEADSTLCLPEDVLSVIFSHLDVAGRARASRVCRKWRGAALQPPHSTELTLLVRLASASPERELETSTLTTGCEAVQPVPGLRAVLLEEAVAALRGPFCSGVQRLSLGLALPPGDDVDAFVGSASTSSSGASALVTIGAALPPNLRTLSLAVLGARWERIDRSGEWRAVLARLDLARTAPRLEDLDLLDDGSAELTKADWRLEGWRIVLSYQIHARWMLAIKRYFLLKDLGLSHPSLRRLDARTFISFRPDNEQELASALQGLPRLEVVSALVLTEHDRWVARLAAAGIRTELLDVVGTSVSETHKRLLGPGSILRLTNGTLPTGEDWTLPAGLAVLFLNACRLPTTQLESLLCRTSQHAPGLEQLVIGRETLAASCRPHEALAALRRVPGCTQLDLAWPALDEWCTAEVLASLLQILTTSPTPARYIHINIPSSVESSYPDSMTDYVTYARSRAAALRTMGDVGRRLLAEQGYGLLPI